MIRSLFMRFGLVAALIAGIWPALARAAGGPDVSSGYVAAWGQSAYGALGTGYPPCCPIRPFPVPTLGLTSVVSVTAGNGTSLAVKRDGTVWAWGNNHRAEFGSPGGVVYRPERVVGLTGIVEVASGTQDSIALQRDGTVWEWGIGQNGSLEKPTRLPQLADVRQIAACGYYHLAVRSDGSVWAWGDLGTGPVPHLSVPTQIPDLHDITQVAIGLDHALALDAAGTVWAWGANYSGQLGHPDSRATATPVQVLAPNRRTAFDRVVEVAAGAAISVALRAGGSVWSWGSRTQGALGYPESSSLPHRIPGIAGITRVVVSTSHVLAFGTGGTVIGWGQNDMGQLGAGVADTGGCDCVLRPTVVFGLGRVTALATGPDHSLAIVRAPPEVVPVARSGVCARQAGYRAGVVLRTANARGLAVDSTTGRIFVLVPGGYDPTTGNPVCAAGIVALDGSSGRIVRRVVLGRATDVVGPAPVAAGAGRVVTAVTGDFVVPVYRGAATVLDFRGRTIARRLVGEEPGTVALDQTHRRAYVTVTSRRTGEESIAVLGLKEGHVLRRLPFGAERIIVAPTLNRVFVIYGGRFVTLNARTSRVIRSVQLPPGGLAGGEVDARTARVFVSEYSSGPPDEPVPPRTISTFNARSGRLIRRLSTTDDRFQVGTLVVDEPAGLVLSSSGRRATILNPVTGRIRRSVTLPAGGLTDATGVDPTDGYIYGYNGSAIVEVKPLTWKLARRIPISSYLLLAMTPDVAAHRMYALYATRSGAAVRSIPCCKP